MNDLIKDTAWGLFVELPTEFSRQMTQWAIIAGVDKQFAQPKRPEFFAGMTAPYLICNEESMPVSQNQINKLIDENENMLGGLLGW